MLTSYGQVFSLGYKICTNTDLRYVTRILLSLPQFGLADCVPLISRLVLEQTHVDCRETLDFGIVPIAGMIFHANSEFLRIMRVVPLSSLKTAIMC